MSVRAADDAGRALKRRDRHVTILGIEQPPDLAATCIHALGESLARNVLCLHRFNNLPSQHFLGGYGFEFFKLAFLFKQAVERGEVVCRPNSFLLFLHNTRPNPGPAPAC